MSQALRATVVLVGLPPAERNKAVHRLQGLGACALRARDAESALEHVKGGTVSALVLDSAVRAHADGPLDALFEEARGRGLPIVGVGRWPALDGVALAGRLPKPLDAGALVDLLLRVL